MSGGLDSSAVAALLLEAGYEVIGLTLHLFKEGSRCCSLEDVERARRICDQLDIRHYTLNAVDEFDRQIIQPFVDEYAAGRTPSPCVLCNQYIKFGILQKRAEQLGCTHVGTGHYVRIEEREGRWHLLRGDDHSKDQSYFLHRLSQEQLSRSLFPLAGWKKTDVALYADEKGLAVNRSAKAESQDLCFVSDDGHGLLVEARRPELKRSGEILSQDGKLLGTHQGIHHFTVGQRKGLGVAASERMYVQDLRPLENQVILAPRGQVLMDGCSADQVHWIQPPTVDDFDAEVRIRYRHPAVPARIQIESPTQIRIVFSAPQFAVTPGQAAVVYQGAEVLGGGWIRTPCRGSDDV